MSNQVTHSMRVFVLLTAVSAGSFVGGIALAGTQEEAKSAPPSATSSPQIPAAIGKDAGDDAPILSRDEASYLLGVNYGVVMRNYDITMEIVPDAVMRGFKDGMKGHTVSKAEQKRIKQFIATVQPVVAQLHAAAAQDFLTENAHKEGVMTTASGMQYKVLTPGDENAQPPKPDELVSLRYVGTLQDGTEFIKSEPKNAPYYPLDGLLKAWQEALGMMKPGAKWRLFVPPSVGYGMVPHPGIPGGSLVIFDLELVKILPAGSTPTTAPAEPGTASSPD